MSKMMEKRVKMCNIHVMWNDCVVVVSQFTKAVVNVCEYAHAFSYFICYVQEEATVIVLRQYFHAL